MAWAGRSIRRWRRWRRRRNPCRPACLPRRTFRPALDRCRGPSLCRRPSQSTLCRGGWRGLAGDYRYAGLGRRYGVARRGFRRVREQRPRDDHHGGNESGYARKQQRTAPADGGTGIFGLHHDRAFRRVDRGRRRRRRLVDVERDTILDGVVPVAQQGTGQRCGRSTGHGAAPGKPAWPSDLTGLRPNSVAPAKRIADARPRAPPNGGTARRGNPKPSTRHNITGVRLMIPLHFVCRNVMSNGRDASR